MSGSLRPFWERQLAKSGLASVTQAVADMLEVLPNGASKVRQLAHTPPLTHGWWAGGTAHRGGPEGPPQRERLQEGRRAQEGREDCDAARCVGMAPVL